MTVVFARALEGDQAADLELGTGRSDRPGPAGSDPSALRAFMALRAVELERLGRDGVVAAAEAGFAAMTVAEADQHDPWRRDAVAAAVARAEYGPE